MGYYADSMPSYGEFFISTDGQEPFCSNQYMLELTISANSPKTVGKISVNLESKKLDLFT